MRNLAAVCLLLSAAPALAADTLSTAAGEVEITPVKHGTVLLEFAGKAWYVDPWSQADFSNLPKADVILITDVHGDHMDPEAIATIRKPSTVIVAPKAVTETVADARVLANGESLTLEGVKIEAIPMYNMKRGPEPGKLFHDKGRGNGYVLDIGGKRIYFSGDTEAVAEMRGLEDIDIAFVCMNLPYTMPPEEAAAGVKEFQPEVVYPYHYRGSDLSLFEAALKGEPIEVRLREWYP